jgi:hypothetical protein
MTTFPLRPTEELKAIAAAQAARAGDRLNQDEAHVADQACDVLCGHAPRRRPCPLTFF